MTPISSPDGRLGEVSSQFGEARSRGPHKGQDWLFRRVKADGEYAKHNPRGSKNYYMPFGAVAVSRLPGRVIDAGFGPYGGLVKIRHAHVISWSMHLRTITVSPGEELDSGSVLGECGGDPRTERADIHFGPDPFYPSSKYGIMHLHFEAHGLEAGTTGNYLLDPRRVDWGGDGSISVAAAVKSTVIEFPSNLSASINLAVEDPTALAIAAGAATLALVI